MLDIKQQIAELMGMTVKELRAKHQEVFGEPSRTGNKEFLVKRVAWRLQSLAEGSLSERARRRAEELAREADIRTTMPRPIATSAGAVVRTIPAIVKKGIPMPGAVITRNYQGRVIEVTVLEKGFEYQGEMYRSLTAVAKAVTGSHWNGNLFFGIKNERER